MITTAKQKQIGWSVNVRSTSKPNKSYSVFFSQLHREGICECEWAKRRSPVDKLCRHIMIAKHLIENDPTVARPVMVDDEDAFACVGGGR